MITPRPTILALTATTLLAACLPPEVTRNPDTFWFTARENLRLGNFNAAGFTPEEVRAQVALTCDAAGLASFEADVSDPADALFGASCVNGGPADQAGRYTADRQPDGTIALTFEAY